MHEARTKPIYRINVRLPALHNAGIIKILKGWHFEVKYEDVSTLLYLNEMILRLAA